MGDEYGIWMVIRQIKSIEMIQSVFLSKHMETIKVEHESHLFPDIDAGSTGEAYIQPHNIWQHNSGEDLKTQLRSVAHSEWSFHSSSLYCSSKEEETKSPFLWKMIRNIHFPEHTCYFHLHSCFGCECRDVIRISYRRMIINNTWKEWIHS